MNLFWALVTIVVIAVCYPVAVVFMFLGDLFATLAQFFYRASLNVLPPQTRQRLRKKSSERRDQ